MILQSKFQSKLQAQIPGHGSTGGRHPQPTRNLARCLDNPSPGSCLRWQSQMGFSGNQLTSSCSPSQGFPLRWPFTSSSSALHKCCSSPRRYIDSNDQITMLNIFSWPINAVSLQVSGKFPPTTWQPYLLTEFLKPRCRLSPDSNFKSPLAHTWDTFCLPSPAGPLSCPFLWNEDFPTFISTFLTLTLVEFIAC